MLTFKVAKFLGWKNLETWKILCFQQFHSFRVFTSVALKEHGCLGLSWMSARNALQGVSESFAAGAEQTPYPIDS